MCDDSYKRMLGSVTERERKKTKIEREKGKWGREPKSPTCFGSQVVQKYHPPLQTCSWTYNMYIWDILYIFLSLLKMIQLETLQKLKLKINTFFIYQLLKYQQFNVSKYWQVYIYPLKLTPTPKIKIKYKRRNCTIGFPR